MIKVELIQRQPSMPQNGEIEVGQNTRRERTNRKGG